MERENRGWSSQEWDTVAIVITTTTSTFIISLFPLWSKLRLLSLPFSVSLSPFNCITSLSTWNWLWRRRQISNLFVMFLKVTWSVYHSLIYLFIYFTLSFSLSPQEKKITNLFLSNFAINLGKGIFFCFCFNLDFKIFFLQLIDVINWYNTWTKSAFTIEAKRQNLYTHLWISLFVLSFLWS